jgi:hypothetical protein
MARHDTDSVESPVTETENERVRTAARRIGRHLDKLSEREQGRVVSVLCDLYVPGAGPHVRREA